MTLENRLHNASFRDTRQQFTLPTMQPAVIPVCMYCYQPKGRVMAEREQLTRAWDEWYGEVYPAHEQVCCSPGDEHHCPQCHSQELQFALRDSFDFDGNHEWEEAHCDACGWTGNAENAAPPKQPWLELQTVAAEVDSRKPEVRESILTGPLMKGAA